ncbi:cyclin-dependent kinase 2-interacting protein-like [Dendronephthya gigantea]|uniref:cyclin-dependent kinase 2-interacting protein-like n=1 Tax=Dendronephthya gigantea TaxID=151771 RepID=UPI00106C48FA|nr:cyclin-dependent kinase 2-interacting protein-like [Dendronephthya gigantea]
MAGNGGKINSKSGNLCSKFQMSKKANKNTPGKSRKSSSESARNSSQNLGKSQSGYDYAGRVRKCCLSWHECVQKWLSENSCGLELATKIVNGQLQNSSSDEDGVDETSSNPVVFGNPDDEDEVIVSDKEKLVKIFESMKDIHKKMCSLTSNFEAISSLRTMKEGENQSEQPVFETWPLANYVSLSRKLANMFEQELRLKERLVAMVLREASIEDRSKLMACLAMWLHQPYIDDKYRQEIELMLLETGLRTA